MMYQYDEDDKLYTREEAEEIAKRRAQEMVDNADFGYIEFLADCTDDLYSAYKNGKIDQAIKEVTNRYLKYAYKDILEYNFFEVKSTYIYSLNGKTYLKSDALAISSLMTQWEGIQAQEKYFLENFKLVEV